MAARTKHGSLIHIRYVLVHDQKSGKPPNLEFLAQAWCLRDRIRRALVEMESPRIIGVRFDPIRIEACGCKEYLSSVLVVINRSDPTKGVSKKVLEQIANVIGETNLNAGSSAESTLHAERIILKDVEAPESVIGPCSDCPTGTICEQFPDGTHGPWSEPTEEYFG